MIQIDPHDIAAEHVAKSHTADLFVCDAINQRVSEWVREKRNKCILSRDHPQRRSYETSTYGSPRRRKKKSKRNNNLLATISLCKGRETDDKRRRRRESPGEHSQHISYRHVMSFRKLSFASPNHLQVFARSRSTKLTTTADIYTKGDEKSRSFTRWHRKKKWNDNNGLCDKIWNLTFFLCVSSRASDRIWWT